MCIYKYTKHKYTNLQQKSWPLKKAYILEIISLWCIGNYISISTFTRTYIFTSKLDCVTCFDTDCYLEGLCFSTPVQVSTTRSRTAQCYKKWKNSEITKCQCKWLHYNKKSMPFCQIIYFGEFQSL